MVRQVAIVGANGVPASYGGWDQLLESFSKVDRDDLLFRIYCTHKTNTNAGSLYNKAIVEVIKLDANGWQSIPYDIVSLYRAYRSCDIVIMLGTSGGIALPIFKMLGQKVILNIDGAEWKRGKWNIFVKAFLKFSEYCGIKGASLVVSDNEQISKYVRSSYSIDPLTIAYGADHILFDESMEEYKKYNLEKQNYAFKVCRIVPENNLDLILNAFSKTATKFVLVGNFNTSKYGLGLRERYTAFPNLILLDPIYDQATLNSLRGNAALYVHGHSVGGTNPSLIEAMFLGLNILSYDVSFNRITSDECAHFYNSEEDLCELITLFERNQLKNLGAKAQQVAKERYTWANIMDCYLSAIDSL